MPGMAVRVNNHHQQRAYQTQRPITSYFASLETGEAAAVAFYSHDMSVCMRPVDPPEDVLKYIKDQLRRVPGRAVEKEDADDDSGELPVSMQLTDQMKNNTSLRNSLVRFVIRFQFFAHRNHLVTHTIDEKPRSIFQAHQTRHGRGLQQSLRSGCVSYLRSGAKVYR